MRGVFMLTKKNPVALRKPDVAPALQLDHQDADQRHHRRDTRRLNGGVSIHQRVEINGDEHHLPNAGEAEHAREGDHAEQAVVRHVAVLREDLADVVEMDPRAGGQAGGREGEHAAPPEAQDEEGHRKGKEDMGPAGGVFSTQ